MFSRRDTAKRIRDRSTRLVLTIALTMPIVCGAQVSTPDIAPKPPPAPVSDLLRQLLEEDARQALARERSKAMTQAAQSTTITAPAGIAEPTVPPASTPGPGRGRLLAISGVGTRLLVRVQYDGRQASYMSGFATPVAGVDLGLHLKEISISPPCATFLDQTQEPIRYCITGVSP
nr:hypothetical protein [Achromobacter ruhlandii]